MMEELKKQIESDDIKVQTKIRLFIRFMQQTQIATDYTTAAALLAISIVLYRDSGISDKEIMDTLVTALKGTQE